MNKITYKRFKECYIRSEEKLLLSTKVDEIGTSYTCITCVDYPHAKPRVFHSTYDRCNCINSIAYKSQCEHEIKIRGCYESTYFELRHKRRTRVQGSLTGWSKNERDEDENGILNFEEEVAEIDKYDEENFIDHKENNHEVN